MDLIDRQAAIDAIEGLPNCYNGFSDSYDKSYIIGVLEELPSADPEIIRCKDCKHRTRNEDRSIRVGTDNWFCLVVGGLCADEFYCGYAERRADETD